MEPPTEQRLDDPSAVVADRVVSWFALALLIAIAAPIVVIPRHSEWWPLTALLLVLGAIGHAARPRAFATFAERSDPDRPFRVGPHLLDANDLVWGEVRGDPRGRDRRLHLLTNTARGPRSFVVLLRADATPRAQAIVEAIRERTRRRIEGGGSVPSASAGTIAGYRLRMLAAAAAAATTAGAFVAWNEFGMRVIAAPIVLCAVVWAACGARASGAHVQAEGLRFRRRLLRWSDLTPIEVGDVLLASSRPAAADAWFVRVRGVLRGDRLLVTEARDLVQALAREAKVERRAT